MVNLANAFLNSSEFAEALAQSGRVDDHLLDYYHGGLVGQPMPFDEYLFG